MSTALSTYNPDDAVWIEPEPVCPGTRRMRRWRQRNPERARIQRVVSKNRTRARRDGLLVTLTTQQWMAYLQETGWRCLACGKSEHLTIGHIVPHCRGGALTLENVQPLCLPCNRKQGTRTIDYRGNYEKSTLA